MTATEARLAMLRARMANAKYDALYVPRADEYLGEYIPAHKERLHWLTGFTGSAGMALVLRDRAALFVDGRYTVQVRTEVSPQLFEYYHLIDDSKAEF
jgi:Xaa-Pro aminopeptidase